MPVQRLQLPVVPETGTPATGPAPPHDAPMPGPPALTVRATRPVPAGPGADRSGGGPAGPAPRTPAPSNRAPGTPVPGSRAQAVQRAVAEAGLTGVPVRVVQPKPAPATTAATTPGTPQPNEATGVDIEELARRLLDPVSRLLRADLRRGRERSGRPYDGRR